MPGLLNHSPADVLRWLLIQQGQVLLTLAGLSNTQVGYDPAGNPQQWPIFVDGENDVPDNCITIYNTQGRPEGRTMVDAEHQEHPGVQLRIRSTIPVLGYQKAQQVAVALDKIANLTVTTMTNPLTGQPSNTTYTYVVYAVTRTGNVIPLGKDSPNTRRSIFTINAVLVLRETT